MTFRRLILCFVIIWAATPLFVTCAPSQTRASENASGKHADRGVSLPAEPLRPADTSNPRATLRSFIEDVKVTIGEREQSDLTLTPRGLQAFRRALSTLDFSTTPDGDSWMVISTRAVLLYEILARIALPPDNAIPDEDDIARGEFTQWTIPGSRIKIQRIADGPRAGEFLFSAWTVQRLPRFYWKVKHLPYRPDFPPGRYEAFLRNQDTVLYREALIRNRLRPVDTASPRSTLEGFLSSVNRAYTLATETNDALKADPPTITLVEARKTRTKAQNLIRRARATLDLSEVPPAIRDKVASESVLMLKEIFDRMALPPIETVYDLEMVRKERARLDGAGPVRWRYPNTSIEIVEITIQESPSGVVLKSSVDRARLKA